MADTLEYWQKIKSDREEDLELELARGEDPELIKLLRWGLEEANKEIEKFNNG